MNAQQQAPPQAPAGNNAQAVQAVQAGNNAQAGNAGNKKSDPRMDMGGMSDMPVMECFPGANPMQIVSTEEALFGYDNFGVKYTAQGCTSCKKKQK